MGVSAMQPIDTRDLARAARAYTTLLEWPVVLGHRHRPRQGCTCGTVDCPVSGAHPLPGELVPLTEDAIETEAQHAPGAGLLAITERFDAVIVPRRVGIAVQVLMDGVASVPCLIYRKTAALLVLPATGRYAATRPDGSTRPDVEVRTGPEGWIALPPSHLARWDTSPWIDPTSTPHQLLHGQDVGHRLTKVLTGLDAHVADTHGEFERGSVR